MRTSSNSDYRVVCGHGDVCPQASDGPYDSFDEAEVVKLYANEFCSETPHRIEVMDASTYGHWTRAEY